MVSFTMELSGLIDKYNLSPEQFAQVVENAYTNIIRELYKSDQFIAKFDGERLLVYHVKDGHHELIANPKSNPSIEYNLAQAVKKDLIELKSKNEYEIFKDRKGELFALKVTNIRDNNTLAVTVDDRYSGEMRLTMSQKSKQYLIGMQTYGILQEVYGNFENSDSKKRAGSQLIFENSSVEFIRQLAGEFISAIRQGMIRITNIARIAGKRTKVVVEAEDSRLKPVAMCVGRGGEIVKSIKAVIAQEPIDFVIEKYDLESKIMSYCQPYHVVYTEIMSDQSVKIVVDLKEDQDISPLINSANITLIKRLLFGPDSIRKIYIITFDEYKEENKSTKQQLQSLLHQYGIAEAETIADEIADLRELLFIHNVPLSDESYSVLKKMLKARYGLMKNEFIAQGGEAEFFDYLLTRCTLSDFYTLQAANILSFENILSFDSALSLSQETGLNISFSTLLIKEAKQYGSR